MTVGSEDVDIDASNDKDYILQKGDYGQWLDQMLVDDFQHCNELELRRASGAPCPEFDEELWMDRGNTETRMCDLFHCDR